MYGNIINEAFGKVTAKSLNVFITQIKCNAYAVLQIPMKRLSLIFGCKKGCKSRNYLIYTLYCGEGGSTLHEFLFINEFAELNYPRKSVFVHISIKALIFRGFSPYLSLLPSPKALPAFAPSSR